ncbi:MAG: fibronectin type III domain-containing protein [Lachnospiraceae bacterium]|nr:fibronectin type III domain-containing protein [Lachnospiraceae bacterium]
MGKRIVKLFCGMLVIAFVFAFFTDTGKAQAADKLMEKYFPKGIEKIKPNKLLIDIDENDTCWIGAIVKQNDDILAMVRDFEACEEYVDYTDDFYWDSSIPKFYVDNGIDDLETTVQFDISIDGGDWQYEKSWDKKEQDMYKDGFTFYDAMGTAYDDNSVYFSIMDAGVAAEGKLLKKTVITKDDYFRFDLKKHTFKVRYRYCVQYGLLNNHEAGLQYHFTDWSDTTTFGKTTDQNLEIPDEMPAPDISNPKREMDEEGKWDYISVMTHFSQDVTDTLNAIYLKTGEREPFVIITEAAVDDLTEKKFYDGYMANATWLSDGQRGVSFYYDGSPFNEKSRILIRAKVQCESLGKDSKYDYAVDKVKGLKAKKTKTTSIALSWSKVDGAEFYEIYSGDNKLLGTSKTNSFTVKKLKAGTGYDFKVRAVADKVFVGLFSDTLQTPTKPAKVKVSSAKLAADTVTVSYKKTAGSGYQIQIASDKKFKNDLAKLTVKSADELKAVLDAQDGVETYYARVRAYITYGDATVYGAWSKTATVK